jgi:hypothetical protein
MQDILKDLLVIELGTMVTAPLAGMMLSDMGVQGGDKTSHWSAGIVLSGAA